MNIVTEISWGRCCLGLSCSLTHAFTSVFVRTLTHVSSSYLNANHHNISIYPKIKFSSLTRAKNSNPQTAIWRCGDQQKAISCYLLDISTYSFQVQRKGYKRNQSLFPVYYITTSCYNKRTEMGNEEWAGDCRWSNIFRSLQRCLNGFESELWLFRSWTWWPRWSQKISLIKMLQPVFVLPQRVAFITTPQQICFTVSNRCLFILFSVYPVHIFWLSWINSSALLLQKVSLSQYRTHLSFGLEKKTTFPYRPSYSYYCC